jgi:hypothetical protein
MPSRRKRFLNVTEHDASVEDLEQKVRKAAAEIQPPDRIATNAPYGFTVQGTLTAADATFSSTVQVNNALTVTSTSAALTVPRMTTTQRDALTAAVGMIIYNTTDSKFQGYAGSSWVNLH